LAANIVNVVVTREAGKNDPLLAWLPPEAAVIEVPLTTTTYFDLDAVRVALDESPGNGKYPSLVVTSERSADYVETALRASAPDVEIFSVGPTTASALGNRDVKVFAQGEGSADSLAPHIARGPVLMLGATSMREELGAALRAKGLEVVAIACYETVGAQLDQSDKETLRHADVLFIGAPSAWAVARENVGPDTWVVVPGASTGAVVRVDHPRVIEGWGPHLRTRLAELTI
jgi:uroporphyrinogen-III synthase